MSLLIRLSTFGTKAFLLVYLTLITTAAIAFSIKASVLNLQMIHRLQFAPEVLIKFKSFLAHKAS